MSRQTTTNSLLDAMSSVIGGSYLISEDRVIFFEAHPYRGETRVEPTASLAELERLVQNASNDQFVDKIKYCNGTCFEVPILFHECDFDALRSAPYYQNADQSEAVSYTVGLPSKDFIVHILLFYEQLGRIRFLLSPETDWNSVACTCDREKESIDVFDLLSGQGRFLTIRIERLPLEGPASALDQRDYEGWLLP